MFILGAGALWGLGREALFNPAVEVLVGRVGGVLLGGGLVIWWLGGELMGGGSGFSRGGKGGGLSEGGASLAAKNESGSTSSRFKRGLSVRIDNTSTD